MAEPGLCRVRGFLGLPLAPAEFIQPPLCCPPCRLSRRKTRSSLRSSRHLRSKDKVEKLATTVGENCSPVLRRVTRATAAALAATRSSTPASPPASTKKLAMPIVEICASDYRNAEQHLQQGLAVVQLSGSRGPVSQDVPTSDEEATPKKAEAGRLELVTVSSMMTTPQDLKSRRVEAERSVSKLRIARASPGSPDSRDSPWRERVLAPILPDNFSMPLDSRAETQSVRRSPLTSPGARVSLVQKYSLVAKQEGSVRRSRRISKKAEQEPVASARIICESGGGVGWVFLWLDSCGP